MFKILFNNSDYSKEQKLLFFVFVSMITLNYGNYSFLFYNLDGTTTENPILEFIKNGRVLMPIVTILYLLSRPEWKNKIILSIKFNFPLMGIGLIFLINSLISTSPFISFIYSIWFIFSLLLIFLVINEIDNIETLIRLIKAGSIVTLILILPSIPSLIAVGNEASYFSSKNYYAYPLLIYFISELFLFLYSYKLKNKLIRYVILSLIMIVLFLSGRRAPTVCALFSFIIYLFYKNRTILIGLLAVVILFSSTILVTDVLGFSLEESLTFKRLIRLDEKDSFKDSSYSERELVWDYYLQGFYDSPIIGNGFNTDQTTLSRYYSGELEGLSYHNTFLQILVESGLIGLFFLIIYFIQTLKGFFKIHSYKIMYFSLFLPTILVNWVESNFFPGQLLFIYTITIWSLFSYINKRPLIN